MGATSQSEFGDVIGVIAARGGSKGVPRKNIKLLGGKPLIAFTVRAALAASSLSRVIVSTDDPDIAAVCRDFGAEVPFIRPSELARDTTPTLPVLQHAVRWFEEYEGAVSTICLLQPTNPFRPRRWIDGCVGRFFRKGADSVLTVLPVPHEYNPHWVYFESGGGGLELSMGGREPLPRRQNLPRAWHREGSVYVCRRDVLLENNSMYGSRVEGYRVSRRRSANIDTETDWKEAEDRLAQDPSLGEP